jgi:hypothetical protein
VYPLDQWEQRSAELTDESLKADEFVERVKHIGAVTQVFVVVVSTLQWGFGDLLFSTAN